MTLKEFSQFIRNVGETFPSYPDYKYLSQLDNSDMLIKIIGKLYNAHLNQNLNCPLIEEFDIISETDSDSFYYDFQNHFDQTCEYYLVESFIDTCILCRNLNYFPNFHGDEKVYDYCQKHIEEIDDDFDLSELILKTITMFRYEENYIYNEDEPYEKFDYLADVLLRIYQLIFILDGDLEHFVNYKKKFEKIYYEE